jgi:hypothetical protein
MSTVHSLPIVNERPLTYKDVKYGMLIEVLYPHGGYHAGRKVYFFNKKGVLIGGDYKFIPFELLRLREGTSNQSAKDRQYPRYFMGNSYLKKGIPVNEKIKMWLFIRLCNIVTCLIKFTQKFMD